MNILRWKRKSKHKIRFKTIVLFIFSLIMTTFAWFAYSKVLEPTLNIHMSAWDMEYYIGEKIPANKKTNPIGIDIFTLYPTMPEQSVIVDIYNNGETLVDIDYQVKSVTIAGTTYEIVSEGETNTNPNYISTASSVLGTNESGEQVYRGVITNDITKFPFTIEVEHSAQVEPVTENAYGTQIPGDGYLKITVNWIGDNNDLDSEWGYRVGEYLANNPTATSAMSIELSVDSYQADPLGGEYEEIFPSTASTRPYLPDGYTKVPGTNLSTGLVITDGNGNEYVWVEVPRTTSVYTTAGINITQFTSDDANGAYRKIEEDLRNYVSNYSTRADVHTDYDALGFSGTNYTTLKQKMLKSIYNHGGFYIGRYETGTTTARNGAGTTTGYTAVIKPNAYPYNYVTCSQAHSVASGMAPTGYTTSLMFGIQWDLVMKYLESKGTSQEMLKTNSTSWGNYTNSEYSLTNENVKYMPENAWLTTIPYEKEPDAQTLIAPGGNTGMCKQNIYDLAGNLSEWTYNLIYSDNYYVGGNGGNYLKNGDDTTATASAYGTYNSMYSHKEVGFRVVLYSDASAPSAWGDDGTGNSGGSGSDTGGPYLPTGFSWANAAHTEIKDQLNNQYVWISVPRDATVYNDMADDTEDTGMSDTTNEDILEDFDPNNLTADNLNAIETELKEYTATYRKSEYIDTFYSTDQHGFADATAYNNNKNTMLASVFKNEGFYVGKYETGIADTNPDVVEARTASGDATQTPVIQANAYPYNFVTNRQAQEIASTKFNGGGYTTSLMFGLQWDLVLKHLQVSNAASESELKSDSTEWGNYTDYEWTIENASAKYSDNEGFSWNDGVDMTNSGAILLSTGASSAFERGGIYDLAGNVSEWTLENTSIPNNVCVGRGANYSNSGNYIPVRGRHDLDAYTAYNNIGFRVVLY